MYLTYSSEYKVKFDVRLQEGQFSGGFMPLQLGELRVTFRRIKGIRSSREKSEGGWRRVVEEGIGKSKDLGGR
jgi:hypothetical protein